MMTSGDIDRPISASEVERWSYCPLSWKMSREQETIDPLLTAGMDRHDEIGKRASHVEDRQKGAKDLSAITWSFIVFSSFMVFMGMSLYLLVRVGFMDAALWRLIVLSVSLVLLGTSLSFYFYRMVSKRKGMEGPVMDKDHGLRKAERPRKTVPVLFYLYGILLLLNGLVLLRPLGLEPKDASIFLTISLLVLFVLLFFSTLTSLGSHRPLIIWMRSRSLVVMVLMLLLSISALFLFLYDRLDEGGIFPYLLVSLALVWFILAIVYDLWLGRRLHGERGSALGGREDLPVATLALLASVITGSIFILGSRDVENYTLFSLVISLLWIGGAFYFFVKASSLRKQAVSGMEELELPVGADIVSVDRVHGKRAKVLVSRKHFLSGTPDLILEEEGVKVPVEVKTGKVPAKPHFSHVMQLGAYLVLTDVTFSQRTPHGYVDYIHPSGERRRFKVEWDMMTKALVLSKVSEIREAERLGEAHRNHNREGKCISCSRRSGCPERLV